MAATRSQKIRLSVFLISVTVIVVATLIYLMGASLLQVRDEYTVLLNGGSGGLEVGSQVRYNDIIVGRVDGVKIDPEDPALIRVSISLDHGTPITEDTIATPEMANITGSKRLAMRGGTKASRRLKPGDTIIAQNNELDAIVTKVVNIADTLDRLLNNLVELTDTTNKERFNQILSDVEGITSNVNKIVEDNQGNINSIVNDAKDAIAKLNTSIATIEGTLKNAEKSFDKLASPQNVQHISSILTTVDKLATNVNNRASEEELGQTIQSVNRLANDTNVTVLRLRSDAQRIIRELETSVENINEFTQILVENPSVLISGRGEKERRLP